MITPQASPLDVVSAYFQDHDVRWFTEDADFEIMPLGQTLHGRGAIEDFLNLFYHDAFSNAHHVTGQLVGDENAAVGEWVFHGRHSGSLMGIAPTDQTVALPMIAIYDVTNGSITRARLYYDAATLLRQLGLEGG